jgi:hypothetical protein
LVAVGGRASAGGTEVDVSERLDWYVAEFGLGDELVGRESGMPPRRLVLVPVGRLDARAVKPLEQAWRVPAAERRALHVVTDQAHAEGLACEWAQGSLSLPLSFVEGDAGVAAAVARVVRMELAAGFEEIVVLAGRRVPHGWVGRVRHGTADAIARAVQRIPAVQVGLVNVPTR